MYARNAHTLPEVAIVLAIAGLLTTILFPVFQRVRETGRRAACLSNMHQLGLSMLQYTQDWDDRFPCGTVSPPSPYLGMGWETQVHNMHCPSDAGAASYAYNFGMVRIANNTGVFAQPPLAAFVRPDRTVLCFEVRDSLTAAVGNGWLLFPATQSPTGTQMATGLLHGATPAAAWQDFNSASGGVAYPAAHGDGANWLLCDGHVAWRRGEVVSPGWVAGSEGAVQVGSNAAGTGVGGLTFSWR